MIKHTELPYYEGGALVCPICNEPLPAQQTWPGARFRYCLKPQCKAQVLAATAEESAEYIDCEAVKCQAPSCEQWVPEGRYTLKGRLVCSPECYCDLVSGGPRVCACNCGQFVHRLRWAAASSLVFVNRKHFARFKAERYLSSLNPELRKLLDEYLTTFVQEHYRQPLTVRPQLVPFLRYLTELGVRQLDEVSPKVMTDYIEWARKLKLAQPKSGMPFLSLFLKWSMAMGYRTNDHPIVATLHRTRLQRRQPRPYSNEELHYIWSLLAERGDTRLHLVVAIAEESGLRITEICNLRLGDLQLERQQFLVRTPNKNMKERVAFFSDNTYHYLRLWLQERDANVDHDYLLYGVHKRPCTRCSLTREFNLRLCKTYHGQQVNPTGLDRWSIHRFRHTMASRIASAGADASTVLVAGGWSSHRAATDYVKLDHDHISSQYDMASRKVDQQDDLFAIPEVLSPEQFLSALRGEEAQPQLDRKF